LRPATASSSGCSSAWARAVGPYGRPGVRAADHRTGSAAARAHG
jgi:hypothetical protein